VGQLYRHRQFEVSNRLTDVINEIVCTHSPLGHASEVAWAIWTAIWYERALSKEAAEALTKLDDSLVFLVALDARDRGLLPLGKESNAWTERIKADELHDRNWLLTYESQYRGWIRNTNCQRAVQADPHFGQLLHAGVSFYDTQPDAPVGYLMDISGYGQLADVSTERDTESDF
jgi:hypothetical protein